MIKTECPNCKHSVSLGRSVVKGAWLACSHCGAGLNVACLEPPMLTRAPRGPSLSRVANWPLQKHSEEL